MSEHCGNRPENEAGSPHGRANEHPHPVETDRTDGGTHPGAGADPLAQFSPMANSAMPAVTVETASGFPASGGSGFGFCGVLLEVAPLAEAFEVIEGIVEEIAVFVVDLAASCGATALAGLDRFESLCLSGGDRARLWLSSHGRMLAGWTAVAETFEAPPMLGSGECVGGILVSGGESLLANFAGFRLVDVHHKVPMIMRFQGAGIPVI